MSFEDAIREEELEHIFRDEQLREETTKWKTFNIVLTDDPVELVRPLTLGKKGWAARLMPLRKVDFPILVNAATIDDLL